MSAPSAASLPDSGTSSATGTMRFTPGGGVSSTDGAISAPGAGATGGVGVTVSGAAGGACLAGGWRGYPVHLAGPEQQNERER